MVGRGACLLALGGAMGCNILFGIDELRVEPSTGGAAGHNASSVTSSAAQSTTGSGGDGGGGIGGGETCAYAEAVLADDPIGYFRLNEASGSKVIDEVSTEAGVYSGAVVLGQPGAVGCGDTAVAFDGTSAEANLGDDRFEFVGGASFTIEVWVHVATVDNAFRPIIAKELLDIGGRQGYFLWVHNSAGLGFELVTDSDPDVAQLFTVPTQQWLHVVGTYDGADSCLYVNAAVQACEPIEVVLDPHPGPFKLGAFTSGAGHFSGRVDEVAIYDFVLSTTRIQAHFDAAER